MSNPRKDGYPDRATDALTRLRQEANESKMAGSRILEAFVDEWIAAGKPVRFKVVPHSYEETRSYVETIDRIAGLVFEQASVEATSPTHPLGENRIAKIQRHPPHS